MKTRFAVAALAAALQVGCVMVGPHPRSHSQYGRGPQPVVYEDSCPPGHRWSDGRCHEHGKGHDPERSRGHGHGHHDDD